MTDEIDEAICAAVSRAASAVAPAEGDKSFLEKRLAAALGSALEDEFPAMTVSLNKRIGAEIPHWDPQPGAPDVAVLDPGQRLFVVAELKLDDVDQTLWDIFKVANALDIEGARAAYVVVAAPPRTWESRAAYAELFGEPGEPEWYSRFLLETHAPAWERLLRGGRGRPTRVPRILFITPLLRAPVAFYPPYELRMVRVGKVDDWLPLVDGRPAGGEGEILDADLTAADLPA